MTARLIVVGAGPGGYVGALHAAALGADVTLIESGGLGGTCLQRGCIPTKALVASSSLLERMRRNEDFGLRVTGEIAASWPDMRARTQAIVTTMETGVASLLRDRGVRVVAGKAAFVDGRTVDVGGQRIEADYVLVSTGSLPVRLAGIPFDDTRVVTSDEALQWKDLPSSLVILGEGVVGCEFAFIFRALGVDVSVVGMTDRPLPTEDHDISSTLLREMRKRKIRFIGGSTIDAVVPNGAAIECRSAGKSIAVAERVLVAVGRRPNTDGIGLEFVGVNRGRRGEILVDANLRSSCPTIYAAGDATGQLMLAHVASAQARAAVDHMLTGRCRPIDLAAVPRATFTDPEVASVGLTEHGAQAAGLEVRCGRFDLRGLGRAQASRELGGTVKIVADANTGKLLGAHIIGPHAAEMIHEAAALVTRGATVQELLEVVHGHPTLSEAVYEAAEDVFGQPIHRPMKRAGSRTASPDR